MMWKMKLIDTAKAFSKSYFKLRNWIKEHFDKFVEKELKKEKRAFFKKYKVEPDEEDIAELKKEIVMRYGVIFFVIILVIVSLFSLKG